DLLSLLLRCRLPGAGRHTRLLDASRGPVITSFLRSPDKCDPDGDGPGYYIQDAGYPVFIDWLAEGTQLPGTAYRMLRFAARRLRMRFSRAPNSELGIEMAKLHGLSELSSGSLPLLGMGRDVPDGLMRLRGGYLDIDWTTATSKPYFDRITTMMRSIADELGATFRQNPLSHLKRVVTVHPLGGCPMGRNDRDGVVDSYGQTYNYPGLYIADGSVMPGPVGPNPSLTIAAFANRMAEHILEEKVSRSRGPGQ
ncbi:MAG: GMC family oxidoreductase, partial [Actinobacteria bacterium]|nr:GMC family oxidoreductase [Actinomycetota bacterium]